MQSVEAVLASKNQFFANMSHEIRTPMNAILGLTHMLLKKAEPGQGRNYLERIELSTKVLMSLINDILDFSKIEAGKLTLETVDYYIDDLLNEVAAVLVLRVDEKGLELTIEIDPEVPYQLCGDPLRLRQVLLNLIGNAIKFTDVGKIKVRVSLEKENE